MKFRDAFHRPRDARASVQTVVWLAGIGGVVAVAVVGLGLYNVSARAGHFLGVSWVLHTTYRNAVALRADAEPPADLETDAMVALGAGHFDSACTTCHAAPGTERSWTTLSMVPQPPHITEAVQNWEADELHWIVDQGVKMSGMPHWPADRHDDVWPVVAFLMRVDAGMTGADYAALTERPDGQYCAMCHGTDGVSGNPHIPRLDILSEAYIAESLAAFRSGARDSGIMAEAMSHVPEETIAEIAAGYAAVAPTGAAGEGGDLVERGRALAAEGGATDVPACRACHGPWPEPLDSAFPSLAGQYEPYLAQQLRLWRDSDRGGTAASQLMHHAARELTDPEIDALAAYYAAMAPATLDEAGSE